jgi:hypothetical protein
MPAPKGHPPYNKNGEGGRPKKYTPEFIEKEAEALEEWMKIDKNMFIEDFCFERGYWDEQAVIFEKENERFSSTYKRFKNKQKTTLFKGGLSKKFNYNMCQFILNVNHKLYQKTEQAVQLTANVTTNAILDLDGATKDIVNDA